MVPSPSRRATLPVVLRSYPIVALGDLMAMDCLECGAPLKPHQPEIHHPDRLLETCEACHCWYLLDMDAQGSTVVMVALPDRNHFLRAIDAE